LALQVVHLFAEQVLCGQQNMKPHCQCLAKLQHAADILLSGDAAVEMTDELESVLSEHHEEALALYGTGVLKIKPHLMHHTGRQIKKHGVNMCGFPPERKHKITLAIAENCFGPGFHIGVLRKCIRSQLEDMSASRMCESYLREPRPSPSLAPFLEDVFGAPVYCPQVSSAIQTMHGIIGKRALLLFVVGHVATIGVGQFYASCTTTGRLLIHVACIAVCDRVSQREWVLSDRCEFKEIGNLRANLAFASSKGGVQPIIPRTLSAFFT